MTIILSIAIALVAGLISTRIVKLLHLPNVTGYLVIGLIIGPYCLKLLNEDTVKNLSIIVTIALGFIAFSIGGEFKISSLKKLGKSIFTITFAQSFMALILVDISIVLVFICLRNYNQGNLALALVLGAIATAKAPAATLMVVRQYKAKGIVTDTLLPVVALDDAFGLMFFSVSFAIAKVFATGDKITVMNILVYPLAEIVCSLLIGFAIGSLLALSMKWFKSRANRLILMITAVLLGVGLCELFENFPFSLSSLLVCMMIGAAFCNLNQSALGIMDGCEKWTPPLFMLFFILSSAELDITLLASIGIVGIVYLISRSIGKYFGSYLGAKIVHADNNVKKYLGFALLPQAGVAIGMAQMVSSKFSVINPNIAKQVVTIVLCATLIYELFGPVLTKVALTKAGEIQVEPKKLKSKKEDIIITN